MSGDGRPGLPGGDAPPATVGWVLGLGSLVDPDDPLVRRMAVEGRAVMGAVDGMRRTWAAGLDNGAAEHDGKHHLDAAGSRPDVVVAALSADEDAGTAMNVLALPVDAEGLARTDARERGYERVEVGARFRTDGGAHLDGPVWIYTASAATRALTSDAAAAGRAVVSAAYVARVEAAFRARGSETLASYRASTDEPPFPQADLRLHWAGVRPGE